MLCSEYCHSTAKVVLAMYHYNCSVLQSFQTSVGLFSQASQDVLPLLYKILELYILCVVASDCKMMEF